VRWSGLHTQHVPSLPLDMLALPPCVLSILCGEIYAARPMRGMPEACMTLREFRDQIDRMQWSSTGGKIFAVGMTAALGGPGDIPFKATELMWLFLNLDRYFRELEGAKVCRI